MRHLQPPRRGKVESLIDRFFIVHTNRECCTKASDTSLSQSGTRSDMSRSSKLESAAMQEAKKQSRMETYGGRNEEPVRVDLRLTHANESRL